MPPKSGNRRKCSVRLGKSSLPIAERIGNRRRHRIFKLESYENEEDYKPMMELSPPPRGLI